MSYTDKLKAHEMVALHYYRFLILCCGLDHRLKLFGEFYDPQDRLSFVSMAFGRSIVDSFMIMMVLAFWTILMRKCALY